MYKKNKSAISLIVLTITIIIMIILAGSIILTLSNNGIINKASNAVDKTNDILGDFQHYANGRLKIDGVWYASYEDYLKKNPIITAEAVYNNFSTYSGKHVDYKPKESANYTGKFQIFYSDSKHIYLIAEDYKSINLDQRYTNYNGTSDFTKENLDTKYQAVKAGLLDKTYDPSSVGSELKLSSNSINMKVTQYLLDTTIWSDYVSGTNAKWAIGAPTLEMFFKAYNKLNKLSGDNEITLDSTKNYGYLPGLLGNDTYGKIVEEGTSLNPSAKMKYWIAAPYSSDPYKQCYFDGKHVGFVAYTASNIYVRPVICLPTNIELIWDEKNQDYDLRESYELGIEITPLSDVTLFKKKDPTVDKEEKLTAELKVELYSGMDEDEMSQITWESSSNAIKLSSTKGRSITITAVGTQNETITVTAKCTYKGKQYKATKTVTLEMLEKPETVTSIYRNLADFLGKDVNYKASATDTNEYQIFYADSNNVYLITKGYLDNAQLNPAGYNGTSDFTKENLDTKYKGVKAGLFNKTYDPSSVGSELKYESSYTNMKATQYLLDITNWSDYADGTYGLWAMGAPTLEMFVGSYNAYYKNDKSKEQITILQPTGNGYEYYDQLIKGGSVPTGTYLNPASNRKYWLACPSSKGSSQMRYVKNNFVDFVSYSGNSYGFRPVICMASNVGFKLDDSTNKFDLVIIK